MAFYPQNGSSIYTVSNVIVWANQGLAIKVGGGYTTTSGIPSIQLLPSTNTTLGYFNGNMLARASGVTSGSAPTGLTAGALVNFDPASTDTGQKVWCGFIICDEDMPFALPITTTYAGDLRVAIANANWKIRQQFLYAGGTPATDVAAVQTAVSAWATVQQFQASNPGNDGELEVMFTY